MGTQGYISISSASHICSDLQTREHAIFLVFSLCGFTTCLANSIQHLYTVNVTENQKKKNVFEYILYIYILNTVQYNFKNDKSGAFNSLCARNSLFFVMIVITILQKICLYYFILIIIIIIVWFFGNCWTNKTLQ